MLLLVIVMYGTKRQLGGIERETEEGLRAGEFAGRTESVSGVQLRTFG